jgi:hypothetical protein
MSDTHSAFELVGSGIVGAAYLVYTWHKRKTQFGGRAHHVRVYAGDRELFCHVCEGNMFYKREGLINTTWATFFKLDPLNESAHCVVCETCGYAHWFATRPGVRPADYLRYEMNAVPGASREP